MGVHMLFAFSKHNKTKQKNIIKNLKCVKIRFLMLHGKAVGMVGDNKRAREAILAHINSEDITPNMQMIACRMISNYIAKRPRYVHFFYVKYFLYLVFFF